MKIIELIDRIVEIIKSKDYNFTTSDHIDFLGQIREAYLEGVDEE